MNEPLIVSGIEIPHGFVIERTRQVSSEGYDQAHDDAHKDGELLTAAVAYRQQATNPGRLKTETRRVVAHWLWDRLLPRYALVPVDWPWAAKWWKPKSPARDLERAGALCLAEIDRLKRANPKRTVRLVERELRRIVEAYKALPPPPKARDS